MEDVITMMHTFSDIAFFSVAFVSSRQTFAMKNVLHVVSEIDGGSAVVQCLQP